MISRRLVLVAAGWIGALPLAAAVLATAAPTEAPPDWSAESDQADAHLGHSVASAGDVNGDGYADVIVGAPFFDNGQSDEGRAYVYLGGAAGLATLAAWTVESNVVNANLGWSVSGAGDVNGDGYDDVIVGVPGDSNGQFAEGRAYVYQGSASGLATTPARLLEAANLQFASFGGSVAGAGDVNDDGYADVIVGANGYGNGQIGEGRAWVFHGSATGVGTAAAWSIESNQAGAEFGYSVAAAGDVNGDGYGDVIIGAWRYDNLGAGSDDGRAFVYHGNLSGLAATPAWTLEGNQADAHLGGSVATAGDFNGDGYADVIVGAPTHDTSTVDAGRVYVAFGSAAGLEVARVWTPSGSLPSNPLRFGTAIGSADVNGDGFSDLLASSPNWGNGVVLTLSGNPTEALEFFVGDRFFQGAVFGQQLGFSAAGAGDVDGDGYDEVIAGAHLLDDGQIDEGGAFVYPGVPGAPYPWRDGDVITYPQEIWGAPPTTTNPAGSVLINWTTVYAALPTFEIGIPGTGGYSLRFAGPDELLAYLPTVGTSGPLTSDMINPLTSSSGVFGGDVAALELNIDFSDAGLISGAAGLPFGDLRLRSSGIAGLDDLTVRQVASIAETLLGGGVSVANIDQVAPIVDLLTNAFNGATVSRFARDHLTVPEPGLGLSLMSGLALLVGLKLRSGRGRGSALRPTSPGRETCGARRSKGLRNPSRVSGAHAARPCKLRSGPCPLRRRATAHVPSPHHALRR